MKTGQASQEKNIDWSTRQTKQAGSHQNSSSQTTNKESFKQALSQFLVDFFSSKHLDQGIDISTQLLSKPLDILTLFDLNIKKSHPEFYSLFKELHNDKKFSELGLDINSISKELHRLLHTKILEKNNPKKLSDELAGFLTNLILTDNSQPKNESAILNNFIHDINKTVNMLVISLFFKKL